MHELCTLLRTGHAAVVEELPSEQVSNGTPKTLSFDELSPSPRISLSSQPWNKSTLPTACGDMRRRHGGQSAGAQDVRPLALELVSIRGLDSLIEHGLLERVCEMLPALEIARAISACRNMQAFAKEVIPRLLAARCRPGLQLQTASASEAAVFSDWMRDTRQWNAGPNTSKPYNVAKEGCVPGDGGAWIFLEQGTDWLGFQGLHCNFASPRPKPKWVSFRLCLQTLEFSCGFFALSADRRTWGLQPLVFIFNYRGDDMQTGKRCFALQTQPVTGDLHVLQLEKDQIRAGVPYEVAVHLDWERGLLELFIDGTCVLRDIHFQVDLEPRYIGLYNWRSRAACGFSEILVGSRRPYPVAESPLQVWRVSESQNRREEGAALTRTSLLAVVILLVLVLVMILPRLRIYQDVS
eukprot:s1339_g25.t1